MPPPLAPFMLPSLMSPSQSTWALHVLESKQYAQSAAEAAYLEPRCSLSANSTQCCSGAGGKPAEGVCSWVLASLRTATSPFDCVGNPWGKQRKQGAAIFLFAEYKACSNKLTELEQPELGHRHLSTKLLSLKRLRLFSTQHSGVQMLNSVL